MAAAVIALAIAMVVAALTARSVLELRLAKAELVRVEAEYAMAAAQNAAIIAISTSRRPPPYRWTMASLGQAVQVLAEPERAKMSIEALAQLDDASLLRLGSENAEETRRKLSSLKRNHALIWIEDQAASRLWRDCAASYGSPFGVSSSLQVAQYAQPLAGQQSSILRAGEVWRIRISDRQGWREERVVRFTGNGLDPAAVLGRKFSRGWKGGERCEALFESDSGV